MTTYVLYFEDAKEARASLLSATDIAAAIDGAVPLPLRHEDWADKVAALPAGSVCFLATHGELGEDGTLQAFLETHGIGHTHSDASASNILANKHAAKLVYLGLGIPTPPWVFVGQQYGNGELNDVLQKAKYGGGKQGIDKVPAPSVRSDYIYESIIPGDYEVSVGVLRDGLNHIALPAMVRLRSTINFGELQEAKPSEVAAHILQECQTYARQLSSALDCFGVTKTDFVIDKKGMVWAIETDAIPGLSRQNAVSKAAAEAGISYVELLNKIKETLCKPTL